MSHAIHGLLVLLIHAAIYGAAFRMMRHLTLAQVLIILGSACILYVVVNSFWGRRSTYARKHYRGRRR